jgi:hypothetical protein
MGLLTRLPLPDLLSMTAILTRANETGMFSSSSLAMFPFRCMEIKFRASGNLSFVQTFRAVDAKCANFKLWSRRSRESHQGIVSDPAQSKLADVPVLREAVEPRLGRIR